MSNLSDLLPSGAGGKSFDFVASGTLASGQTVGLTSDGKVEAVVGATAGVGSKTQFENGQVTSTGSCYDTGQDKILVCYSDNDNSGYMTLVVGTLTANNAISFGTPVVANSAYSNYCIAVFDPTSGKSLIGGQDGSNSYNGAFFAVTISGTTPSVGSKTSLFGAAQYLCAVYNTTEQKILVACNENSNSNYAAAAVATISGTSVSFGTKIVWNSQDSRELNIAYDSVNNNNVCVFKKQANSWGQFGILVVSGTSVSVISTHTFAQVSTRYPSVGYDVDKATIFITFQNDSSSSYLWYACVTLSGNSPTTGTAAQLGQFVASGGTTVTQIYHPVEKKIIITYGTGSGTVGYYDAILISGLTANRSGGVAVVSEPAQGSYYYSLAYNPDLDNVFLAYASGSRGESYAFNLASTNSSSYVGITEAAISNAATGTVTLQGGINTTAITNTATTTFAITVANPGSGNRYYIDGALQATVSLSEGRTYKFDQSDGTNGGHPLRFSTTSDGTHGGGSEYTTGVTAVGVPGNAGAYTQIVVAIGAPTLYYYCTAHSGMGGTANTPDDARFTVGSTYYVQNDGTLGTGSTSIVAGEALSATSINLVNT